MGVAERTPSHVEGPTSAGPDMSPEKFPDPAAEPLVSRPRRTPRPVVVAGVAAACFAGGALGFWARPEGVDRQAHKAPPAQGAPVAQVAPAAPKRIEIR